MVGGRIVKSSFERRVFRVRNKVKASAVKSGRKRLSVFRSLKNIYAQVIDDASGKTLASASTLDKEYVSQFASSRGGNVEAASRVGEVLAKRALEQGIKEVYFDRGAYKYHGRVKALADSARAGGLVF